MDIRSIKSQARQVQQTTSGIYALFFIPILSQILSITYHVVYNQADGTSSADVWSSSFYVNDLLSFNLSGLIFALVTTILLSLFKIATLFTSLEVIRKQRDQVGLMDSFRAFEPTIFGKILRTLLLKEFLLFLWNLIGTLGSFLLIASMEAFAFSILTSHPDPFIGNFFVMSLILSIIGFALFIPQYYAYSQVDYLLYDRLFKHEYQSAFRIIRDSRRLMKGYKAKRFALDVSFVGWWLLTLISLGFLGGYTIPYQALANTIFYQEIKQKEKHS